MTPSEGAGHTGRLSGRAEYPVGTPERNRHTPVIPVVYADAAGRPERRRKKRTSFACPTVFPLHHLILEGTLLNDMTLFGAALGCFVLGDLFCKHGILRRAVRTLPLPHHNLLFLVMVLAGISLLLCTLAGTWGQ